MDETNEDLRVVPELYFLIAKFLSGGPLKETAKTLLKELETVEVLPRRLDWEGNEHAQSYNDLESQYSELPWSRLAAVCQQFLLTAQGVSPLAERKLSLSARLSLLSDSLVRAKPKYSVYKEDHSLVRRLASRELGCGRAGTVGGKGGEALMSPRMLSGLQLQRRTLGHLSAVYCVVFDRTGRYVLTGADDLLVKVWSATDGRLLATLRGAGAEITDADVSRDGALLAAGSVERLVRVWCLATGAPKAVLHAHAGTITSVRWAPPSSADVRWLASTSTDGSVAFWTCSSDGQFLSQPVQYVERMRPGACHMICAAWSAGGGFLAAGSADHHVRVYMVQGSAPRRVLEVAVHSDAVDSIAWAHRGLRFVTGSKDGSAALWTLHATQWRHTALRCEPATSGDNAHEKRLKVTMVCWDCSDAFILTAVSDKTLRVWCARSCTQVRILRGHRDEAYVLEAHPALPGVVLSAGHDGQLLVWEAPRGELLASFHNDITGQGDGAIFDAKWGGLASIAATDSHGHLLLLGLGAGHQLLQELPQELFFHTDYRPLVRDALGGALDEQTETPPHLMAPGFLVDVEGAPHPPRYQRLVPGRENLSIEHLIPVTDQPMRPRLLMEELADLPLAVNGLGLGGGEARGVWRGEGVRHTAGSWQREPILHSSQTIVQPLPRLTAQRIQLACAEMNALEQAWYRREMRRRPLMINTAVEHPRRRKPPRAPRRAPQPPAPQPPQQSRPSDYALASPAASSHSASLSSASEASESSDASSRVSSRSPHARPPRPARTQRPPRARQPRSSESDASTCSYTSEKTEESSESSYSDWEAGAEMAPPARARRRPLPARRYSPSTVTTKRTAPERAAGEPSTSAAPSEDVGANVGANIGPSVVELPEAYRPGEWLCAVSPRKAPYHPQMGDMCLYFRLGHQRYFEAVAEKDVYKVNPRDKPWERTQINECELVKVVGVKYVIKPPRIVCLRLACVSNATPRQRIFTVKYHDMPDVIDFLVLKQQYDIATQRHWGPGDRFRCMIDDSWWTGVVVERTAAAEGAGGSRGGAGAEADWAARAALNFLSLKVRWDNGEVERLSPWDLEPIDADRLPSEPGGAVPVLPHELEAVLYRAEPEEWPPNGNRAAACRAIANHISQVMSLSVAEPFVAPVDLQLYPSYALVVPYPIDLSTIRARFENLFYRRTVAAQFDVRYLASNAEQFNQPHSTIVRQARLVTDLLLHIISEWRSVDVVAKYHELAAAYHSSDDEPLAKHATKSNRSRRQRKSVDWRLRCGDVLNELMRSTDAEPFKQPVSLDQAPDYTCIVTHPIDLGTVATNLQSGVYTRASRFVADVRRVFSNSRLYNTNKRSRIYSMTVRLSALFESLWSRSGLDANGKRSESPPPAPRRPRRAAARTRRVLRRVLTAENGGQANGTLHSSASDSDSASSSRETLAATSRRVHNVNGKGKGVGKKSGGSGASAEPTPGPSTSRHSEEAEEYNPSANGIPTDSEDEALARIQQHAKGDRQPDREESDTQYTDIEVLEEELDDTIDLHYSTAATRQVRIQQHAKGDRQPDREESDTQYTDIEVLEEELDDTIDLHYSTAATRQSSRKRKKLSTSGSSESDKSARTRRKHTPRKKRTRERFTDGSSSSSSSSDGADGAEVRRYESDHSYKPRYSTDDDAPLHLYRQRQEGAGGVAEAMPGPSTSARRAMHRPSNRGVSLRARRSPRRYNEDSEEDSIACISKRLPHHQHRRSRQELLSHRRTHHARQSVAAPAQAGSAMSGNDHDYYHATAAGSSQQSEQLNGRNSNTNDEDDRPAVSISSRGRVRKLTAKARGLLH